MRLQLLNFIFGTVRLKAEGVFPERIINIANQMGIFIQDITKTEEKSILFSVSSEGARRLLSQSLPPEIALTVIKTSGFPWIKNTMSHRKLLFIGPCVIALLLFLSTQFIWTVNIIDADPATEEKLLHMLKDLGVKRGALKFTINQSEVKDKLLMKDDSLLWIWVDIKGSGAIVKFANRTMPPAVFNENEGYNIYSLKEGTVTRIVPTNGNALVRPGDSITKGQLLIEGIMPKNPEETKYIHASGEVFASVWEEKIISIPKKKEIRTPTGKKTQHLSIIFSKFPIKLFINSRILYTNYDIIVSSRTLSFIPITFKKEDYREVTVTYQDNNIDILAAEYLNEFKNSLSAKGYSIISSRWYVTDNGDSCLLTMNVLCEEMVATERRINFGENNSVSDS